MSGSSSGDYVPRGLPAGSADASSGSAAYVTGGNTQAPGNGWDTPFFMKFVDNYQKAMDEGRADKYFEDPAASGIVMADGQKDASGRVLEFGDVYDNGKFVANLYKDYDKSRADSVMGQLVLSADEQLNGVSVDAKRAEIQRNVQSAQSRASYDQQVKDLKGEWGETGDEAALGGAVGTGLLGAGIGTAILPGVGTAVGGALGVGLGALGAWLNQDELTDMAARGEVQARQAEQESGAAAGTSARLQSWAGLAGKSMSPVGNLLHGGYDAAVEGARFGDNNESAFYKVDEVTGQQVRPAWMTAADVGAGFADAALQFASPAGQVGFQVQMGGTIAGKASTMLTTGGKTFNERTGRYDSVFTDEQGEFDLASSAAGVVDVGIDVIQLGMGRGIAQAARAARGAAPATDSVIQAGMKFTLDAEGKVISHRLATSVLAPSEAIQALGVRAGALLEKGRRSGALSSDDLYRATQRMHEGPVLGAALVNGFAEGGEEAVQAVAEPMSHGEQVDPNEMMNSFFMGTAMGAGMSAGARYRSNPGGREFSRAQVLGFAGSRADWDALADDARRQYRTTHPAVERALTAEANAAAKNMELKATESVPALQRVVDAEHAMRAAEQSSQNLAIEGSYVISQASYDIDDHMVQGSINTVEKEFGAALRGLQEQIATETDAELAVDLPLVEQALTAWGKRVSLARIAFYAKGASKDDQRAVATAINALLARGYEVDRTAETKADLDNALLELAVQMNVATDLDVKARLRQLYDAADAWSKIPDPASIDEAVDARAIELTFERDPADNIGSFQGMLPQVHFENSVRRADTFLQVTHGVLQALSGDYDGDKLNQKTRIVVNRDMFLNRRAGLHLLGAMKDSAVNIMQRDFEDQMVQILGIKHASANDADRANAEAAVTNIEDKLLAMMPFLAPKLAGDVDLIGDLVEGLRNGDTEARKNFLNRMALDFPVVAETGVAKGRNYFYAANSLIQRELQLFQIAEATGNAATAAAKMTANKARPRKATTKVGQRLARSAATISQRVYLATVGSDLFRKWQKLHYTDYTATELGTEQQQESTIRELNELYELVSSGMTESAMAALHGKDAVISRVLTQLTNLVNSRDGKHLGGGTQALALIANVRVPNVVTRRTAAGMVQEITHEQVSLAQWLLRKSVDLEEAKNANVLDRKPELRTKYARLRSMSAGQAFVEVFGSYQMRELLGMDAAVIGANLTVAQWYASYVNQDENGRQDEAIELKSHSSYLLRTGRRHNLPILPQDLEGDGDKMTAYQSVVDALLEAGNSVLTWNAGGKNANGILGRVEGRIGDGARMAQENFQTGIEKLQVAMSDRRLGHDIRKAEHWEKLFESNQPLARDFLNMIQDTAVFGSFAVKDGKLHMAKWVYQMLTLPPAEAEMEFFRQTKLASFNALGALRNEDGKAGRSLSRLKDRWHILMYQLAEEERRDPNSLAYSRFLERLYSSKNLDAFVAFVNNEIRVNEAPFTSWNSDLSEIDPTATKGGWQSILESATQKEAMLKFRQRVDQFTRGIDRELLNDSADATTRFNLRNALANKKADQSGIKQLEAMLDFAKVFYAPMGPATRQRFLAINLADPQAHGVDKGTSSVGAVEVGAYQSQTNAPNFGTPEQVVLASLTAYSTAELGADPTMLMKDGWTLMDELGRPIHLDQLDAATFLELDKKIENRPLLNAILHPAMYEMSVEGRVEQRFLTDLSLSSLVDPTTLNNLLLANNPASRSRYASYVDGIAGDEKLTRYLNEVLVAQTSRRRNMIGSDSPEAIRLVQEAEQNVVELLQMLAQRAGEMVPWTNPDGTVVVDRRGNPAMIEYTESLKLKIKAAYHQATIDQRFGTPTNEQLLKVSIEEAKVELFNQMDPDTPAEHAEYTRRAEMLDALAETDFMAQVANKFGDSQTEAGRFNLYEFVWQHPDITTKAFHAAGLAKLQENDQHASGYIELPSLTEKEWDEISRAVVVYLLERESTTTLGNVGLARVPGKTSEMDLKFFDPSRSYLIDDLLALVPAAKQLRDRFGDPTKGRTTAFVLEEDILRKMSETVLNPKKLGPWTSQEVAHLQQGLDRLDSAGAPFGISRGGSGPQQETTEGMAARRTFATKSADGLTDITLLRSVAALKPGQLGGAWDSELDITRPDGRTQTVKAGMLDGRFADEIILVDKTTGTSFNVRDNAQADPAVVFPSAQADIAWGSITRNRLDKAVASTISRQNLDPTHDLEVQVRFLHPFDQPATPEFANNVYFEGVALESGDQFPSLNAAWVFAPGGRTPEAGKRALQANKKRMKALRKAARYTAAQRTMVEALWKSDFEGMLLAKTHMMLRADLGGGERINPIFHNAVLKAMKMRHFVRFLDTVTGQVQVLSAEQAIAAQQTGGLPADAELWVPSESILRTLLGERGKQGETRALVDAEFDPTTIPAWTGEITAAHLERVPGLATMLEGNLFASPAARQGHQREMGFGSDMDQATKSRFQRLMLEQQELSAEIELERQKAFHRDDFGKKNEAVFEYARTAMKSPSSVGMMRAAFGLPSGVTGQLAQDVDKKLTEDLDFQMARTPHMRAYLFHHNPPKNYQIDAAFERTPSTLENKGAKPQASWIAPGEPVVVELDEYIDEGLNAEHELRRDIAKMLDVGAAVVLVSTSGTANDLRTAGSRYLRENGYKPLPGSRSYFMQVDPAETPISEAARYEKKMEVTRVETFRMNFTAATDFLGLQENTGVVFETANGQRSVAVSDPIPINAFEGFGLPDASQVEEIKQMLASGFDALAKQSETYKDASLSKDKLAKLKRAVDKAAAHLNGWGTYDAGYTLERGDIIPLVHRDGRVILTRHGFAPPDAEQLRKQFSGDQKVAIYSPSILPVATTHDGEVISIEPDGQYGLRAILAVDLQTLGDKVYLSENAQKLTLTAPPEWLKLPTVLRNRPIRILHSLSDLRSKENLHGLGINFGNLFMGLGIDFTPDVAKALFNTATPTQAQLDMVPDFLERFRRTVDKVPTLRQLDLQMQLESVDTVYREAMALVVPTKQEKALGATDDWADKITTTVSPETRITRGILLYLMAEEAQVEDVLGTPGLGSDESLRPGLYTRQMPEMFWQLFQQTPLDDPLRAHVVAKLQDQLDTLAPRKGGLPAGAILMPDLRMRLVSTGAKQVTFDIWPQFSGIDASGDNPALSKMAQERVKKQTASPQLASMAALTWGARTATSGTLKNTEAVTSGNGIVRVQSGADLQNLVRGIPVEEISALRRSYTLAERDFVTRMRQLTGQLRQPLNTSRWSKQDEIEYDGLRAGVALAFGLREEQAAVIDFWVRKYLGRPKPLENPDAEDAPDQVDFATVKKALSEFKANRKLGRFPVMDGEIPVMDMADVALLFNAAEASGPWLLSRINGEIVTSWEDWVHVALSFGATDDELFDVDNLNGVDAALHTFHGAGVRFAGLPLSFNPFRAEQLMDPETSKMVLSVSPHRREQLKQVDVDATQASLDDLYGGTGSGLAWKYKEAATHPVEQERKRRARWHRTKEIATGATTTSKGALANGQKFVTEGTTQNALFRTLLNMRAALALLNPMLYLGAPVEGYIQETLERTANMVTADGTTGISGAIAGLTPAERRDLRQLYSALGSNSAMKGLIYSEFTLHAGLFNAGPIEAFSHRLAKLGGKLQDPYWGMKADTVAQRYVESALRFIDSTGEQTTLTPVLVSQKLAANPEWLKQKHPAAHHAAMNVLMNIRNVKPTVVSLAWRGTVEPLSSNPRLIPNAASTLFLKLPFMFMGYTMNKAVQLLGLQGWDQATAMFLHGRKNPVFGRIQALMAGKEYDPEATIDMSDVIETLDLTNAIVKAGITHSSLFAFGMMAGGLGLSGEDEEDRRRRRAAKYKGFAYLYDPRDIVNDFRNADAIYLDWLPFGWDKMFQVTDSDAPGGARSMAQMNWVVKSILSPIIGMERFFNTGNPWELTWGYKDAFYSMPLVNTMLWDDANQVFAELATAAMNEEAKATPESLPKAFDFWTRALMSYERMLLESSFINSLYAASDKYDRDAWVLPERGADGKIVTNRLGIPQPTGALEERVDPITGKVVSSYVGRDWWDATLHGFTENRGTLAILSQLFTGWQGGYLRQDMAVKTRKIEKDTSTLDDALAVTWGLWKGSTSFDSPSMEGMYIPFEMRKQVQEELMDRLVKQGRDAGLTKAKAEKRMKELWYGSSTNPTAVPLKDIVWSDKISYKQSDKYYQLNTTYIIGPDGKPWATGISRTALANLAGILPLQRYNNGDVGMPDTDNRLNSVDTVRGINTGMRSLEKVDDSFAVPEEKAAATPAGNAYTPFQFTPFKRRRGGGGGGGGGGGSPFRLQAPQDNIVAYGNDVSGTNLNSTIIRRANLRRERVDSEKGRLKPWE